MALALAPHIHLATLGEDAVLLDVAGDAYMCIPGGRDLLRPSPDLAGVSPVGDEVLQALIAAGLVVTSPTQELRRPIARPARDFGAMASDPLSLREALRLAGALMDLALRYRGRRFSEILAFVAKGKRGPPGAGAGAETLRLARVFQRVAVWLPMPRKCLVRSFVLLRFLQRSGLAAQWVFGVRTWPFAAHCWLQFEDQALDDLVERLAAYEPILAVG